jgi:hypothetical protein
VTHEPTAAEEPLFEQGPRIPLGVPLFPLSLAIAIPLLEQARGVPMDARAWWALIGVCGGLFVVLAAATLPQSMKRVRVDRGGVHLQGELALDAARIGGVEPLRGRRAAALSWPATRPKGLSLRNRQNLYGGALGFGPAVAFEEVDEQGRHRSSWLVPTRTPETFATALEHARDQARRPR